MEARVYPLKLLDSATCDDVALLNLYDLQGTSSIIYVFGVPTSSIIFTMCVLVYKLRTLSSMG